MCLENISRGVFRESMCGNPKKFDFRLENENLLYISVILNITYFMKKIKLLGKNMTCFSNLKHEILGLYYTLNSTLALSHLLIKGFSRNFACMLLSLKEVNRI